jgi:hypothetical protein
LVLLFCFSFSEAQPAPTYSGAQKISIRGNQFIKNGVVWRAKGVDIEAFITCTSAIRGAVVPSLRRQWGPSELSELRAVFHIDTIRFQVSQVGVDPKGGLCDASYTAEIRAAVALARRMGFVVILSMDWQAPTGVYKPAPQLRGIPDEQTVRAWQALAPLFAADDGVLYELFVEPKEPNAEGGPSDWAAGIQPVIDAVRAVAARKVLLLDGLNFARSTAGLDRLVRDTIPNGWGFVVDPQFRAGYTMPSQWDDKFGNASRTRATLAAGWNFNPKNGCVPGVTTPKTAESLLAYLKARRIGLIAWGDFPGNLWRDNDIRALSTYSSFTGCHDGSASGAGEIFAKWAP